MTIKSNKQIWKLGKRRKERFQKSEKKQCSKKNQRKQNFSLKKLTKIMSMKPPNNVLHDMNIAMCLDRKGTCKNLVKAKKKMKL